MTAISCSRERAEILSSATSQKSGEAQAKVSGLHSVGEIVFKVTCKTHFANYSTVHKCKEKNDIYLLIVCFSILKCKYL